MASTSIQKWSSPSSSSSTTTIWTYDVFLSFRGEDVRNNFIGHLYEALKREGIEAYKDDKELERGKVIKIELPKAITESRSAIVVLSEDYASSKWCLEELAQIMEMGQTVLPVFYHVDPSDVRRQSGSFKTRLTESHNTCEDARRWRDALTKVGNLSGWHVTKNRYEPEIIKELVDIVFNQLRPDLLTYDTKLIGINSRVHQMNMLLGVGLDDVRFVGIWGMGGIGKTTIARVVYKSIADGFDGSIFLANVRENSKRLHSLQGYLLSRVLKKKDIELLDDDEGAAMIRQRLRNKKLLIVLDDVSHLIQLKKLAGGKDWFGRGSRVIITTRDERLLVEHEVHRRYKVVELNYNEALQLFCQKAFGAYGPKKDFVDLSNQVVKYAGCLPLALEVLGSSLRNRPLRAWTDAINKLKEVYNLDIYEKLKISYDGLDLTQRETFLDIACFFKGKSKDRVTELLVSFDFHPLINLDVLTERSLITISHNKIWMHDLLQEMGKEIIRRESLAHPGMQSRIWLRADVERAFRNQGVEATEGIVLEEGDQGESCLNAKSFSVMTSLRVLEISNVHLSGEVEYFSDELRLLNWHGYPSKCLPSNFQPKKLLELSMPCSHIKSLWRGTKRLDKLKLIDLSDSLYLSETPDFSGFPNLERLILSGCAKLDKLHPSIGVLAGLILLNLKDCKQLKSLPSHIRLESLEIFILSGCLKLKKFPEIVGDMKRLKEIHLDGTAIEELHSSIGHLSSLSVLILRDCKKLLRLPSTIGSLTSLKTLILYGCLKLDQIPESLGNITCLEKLDISGTSISHAPPSLLLLENLEILCCEGLSRKFFNSLFPSNLSRNQSHSIGLKLISSFSGFGFGSLRVLNLSECNLMDGDIPNNLHSFSSLEILDLSGNRLIGLPESLCQLTKLRDLILINCRNLRSLPKLPLSLRNIEARDCVSLMEYYNQEKYIPSSETGMTIISCPITSESQNFKIDKVNLSSIHLRTMIQRYLEVLTCQREKYYFTFPFTEAFNCFDQQRDGSPITIHCPPDLQNDNKKIGLAISATFEVEKHENMNLEISCRFVTRLETDECPPKSPLLFDKTECELEWPHGLWVFYIPFRLISNWLSQSCCIDISITSSNPMVSVKKCGVSVLYEHNAAKFIGKIVKGFFGSPGFFQRSIIDHILNKQNNVDVCGLLEGGVHYKSCWLNALQRTLGSLPKFGPSIQPTATEEVCTTATTSTSSENQCDENESIALLKRNLKSVLQRTFEELKHNGEYYIFPQREISKWFTHQLKRKSVTIALPPDLHKDKRWMGLAMSVLFAVDENSRISHTFSYQVESDEYPMDRPSILRIDKHMFDGSCQLWVLYEPRGVYPYELNKWRHIRISFVTHDPHMKVVSCSARLVYHQNVQGWVDSIIDCILKSPTDFHEFYNRTFVEGLLSLISQRYDSNRMEEQEDLESGKTSTKQAIVSDSTASCSTPALNNVLIPDESMKRNGCHISRLRTSLESFFQRNLQDRFESDFDFIIPGCEIPKLFSSRHKGNRAAIQLPPTLYTNSDWIGFTVCALISVNKHPTAILDSLGSVICHDLFCEFAIKQGVLQPLHVHTIAEDRFLWLDARQFIWLFYTPRRKYSTFLRHCSCFGATLDADSPDLVVERCGLHLVHKRDRKEIDNILMESVLSSSSTGNI